MASPNSHSANCSMQCLRGCPAQAAHVPPGAQDNLGSLCTGRFASVPQLCSCASHFLQPVGSSCLLTMQTHTPGWGPTLVSWRHCAPSLLLTLPWTSSSWLGTVLTRPPGPGHLHEIWPSFLLLPGLYINLPGVPGQTYSVDPEQCTSGTRKVPPNTG